MSGPSKRLRVARIAPRAKAWLEESRQAFVQYSFERVVDLVNQESDLVAISSHEIGAGPFSLVMNQVTNGVAVRMAVLYLLVTRTPAVTETQEAADVPRLQRSVG